MRVGIAFGHPLYGAELRLARARSLIGTMHRQYQRWANVHEGTGIRQSLDRSNAILSLSAMIHETSTIHVPRISITLGEIVYNVRSALDFLIYSIARARNDGVEIDGTQFPIENSEERYWMRWTGRDPSTGKAIPPAAHYLRYVPEDVARDLAHYQPFSKCEWVTMIRDISNRDKHRHLSTLTTTARLVPDEHPPQVGGRQARSIHLRGQIEVAILLPTGEDVIEAAHLAQREATALIRGYAERFSVSPPGFA